MTPAVRKASDRSPVALGRLLGKGGEGAVYPVVDASDVVAKVYHEPPTPSKIEKLAAMTRTATPRLLRVAAWPIELLIDESDTVRGFLMPKVAAREDVHELYSPKSRREAFPYADFRFVVRASTNIARAIATVHLHGHVIGDINHGNALIGRDGTVMLIDCDSFQIHDGSRDFTCDVGVALFTPPELHGKHFRGLQRSPNHDAFGLAVMLFHLLYAGRHPFAGVYADGEMSIEAAIRESRFPYGKNARAVGMSAPPGALPLSTFGPAIADLFERAFASPGSTVVRPAPTDWVTGLGALEAELQRCGTVPLHMHPRGAECCWCQLESATGTPIFGASDAGLLVPAARLAALWRDIETTPRPPEVPRTPPSDPEVVEQPLGPPTWRQQQADTERSVGPGCLLTVGILSVGIGLAVTKFSHVEDVLAVTAFVVIAFAIANWSGFMDTDEPSEHDLEHERLQRKYSQAMNELTALLDEWSREFSRSVFDSAIEDLNADRDEVRQLPQTRLQKLEDLRHRTAHRKWDAHLRSFSIEEAGFSWCSPEQASTLARHGLRTAADVMHAAGTLHRYVDDAAAAQLEAWYQAKAAELVADPTEPLDPKEVAELEESLRERREVLLERLREGPARLYSRTDHIVKTRDRLQDEIAVARRNVKRTLDDLYEYRARR